MHELYFNWHIGRSTLSVETWDQIFLDDRKSISHICVRYSQFAIYRCVHTYVLLFVSQMCEANRGSYPAVKEWPNVFSSWNLPFFPARTPVLSPALPAGIPMIVQVCISVLLTYRCPQGPPPALFPCDPMTAQISIPDLKPTGKYCYVCPQRCPQVFVWLSSCIFSVLKPTAVIRISEFWKSWNLENLK